VITGNVPCRRCGYEQRGLAADGVCPECGLETWISVREAVDPAARRLPRISHPVSVAHALVWVTVCELLAVLIFVARPVAVRIDQLDAGGLSGWSNWTPPGLSIVAGVVALLGLWSVWKLLPPRAQRGRGGVRTDILFLLATGLAAFGVLAISGGTALQTTRGGSPFPGLAREIGQPVHHLLLAAAAITAYVGLRGVLQEIGQRSREFRTAKGGRQRVRDIIAAIVGVMVGEGLRLAGAVIGAEGMITLGRVIIWICMLMLVIGQGYLVLNACWIARALTRPRPALREVLGDALPTGRIVHPPRGIIESDTTDGTEQSR
jgi:hypothetical protein